MRPLQTQVEQLLDAWIKPGLAWISMDQHGLITNRLHYDVVLAVEQRRLGVLMK